MKVPISEEIGKQLEDIELKQSALDMTLHTAMKSHSYESTLLLTEQKALWKNLLDEQGIDPNDFDLNISNTEEGYFLEINPIQKG